MARGKQAWHKEPRAQSKPHTRRRNSSGGEAGGQVSQAVTPCALRPGDDTAISVSEQAGGSLPFVLSWKGAGPHGQPCRERGSPARRGAALPGEGQGREGSPSLWSLLRSLPVLLQPRVSLSPLRSGANYSGFLTGSFLRTSDTHQEGSSRDTARKARSPVLSCGLCSLSRQTDHQGLESKRSAGQTGA